MCAWRLLVALAALSQLLSPSSARTSSELYQRSRNVTFDYVVIGGGTAALVVATRLAEANRSVAVIEAGGYYEQDVGNISTVPAYAIYGAGSSPDAIIPGVDWGFVTTPQAGMNNRSLHYARGKTLGGSSARNYYTYQRPTAESLERWANLVDDSSYEFDNLLPYYKKSVDYEPPNNDIRPSNASAPAATHAFSFGSGPLRVSFADNWVNPISSFFKVAWNQLGIQDANDFVSGSLSGVQYVMNTINPDGNIRDSSYSAFLQNTHSENSVFVYNNSLAKRILFSGSTAFGVLVNSGGEDFVLSARQEVILSAGVFQSPQLLMVSGIGPKATLENLDIPVISALSGVGQNLEDHLLIGASYQVNLQTHSALGNPAYYSTAASQYNGNGTGMLSNPGAEVLAWDKVNAVEQMNLSAPAAEVLESFPEDWPNFEFLILDAYSGNNENYLTGAPNNTNMYASPSAAIMVQQSRGTVTISSRDATVPPVINPNWLTHPVDQELALIAFKRMREMMDTDVMKQVWVEEALPGRNVTSDAAILNAIRQTGIQLFHAACTCKMGRMNDTEAVVDSRARVFGTKNLRVVDASILPFLPPGHPQATIYALAEKMADDILQ
ncbi:hypothetical protein DE146DRAFT_704077, partial [Phaeosphaeria sp. MPI-PUGE-AT-0046c]